jgi:hypothetical protein
MKKENKKKNSLGLQVFSRNVSERLNLQKIAIEY